MTAAVLVVREFDNFSRILTEAGFRVVNCVATRTVETDGAAKLAELISHNNYDGYFITSRRAAEVFRREAKSVKGRVYVLGRSSFEILADNGLDLSFAENANTARELIATIPADELKNKHFLFVRGDRSLGTIGVEVREVGALDEIVVYRNEKLEIDRDSIAGEFAAVCFFSPSAAESFLAQAGRDVLTGAKIAAIGPTTQRFLEIAGLKVNIVSDRATAEHFAENVIEFLRREE